MKLESPKLIKIHLFVQAVKYYEKPFIPPPSPRKFVPSSRHWSFGVFNHIPELSHKIICWVREPKFPILWIRTNFHGNKTQETNYFQAVAGCNRAQWNKSHKAFFLDHVFNLPVLFEIHTRCLERLKPGIYRLYSTVRMLDKSIEICKPDYKIIWFEKVCSGKDLKQSCAARIQQVWVDPAP